MKKFMFVIIALALLALTASKPKPTPYPGPEEGPAPLPILEIEAYPGPGESSPVGPVANNLWCYVNYPNRLDCGTGTEVVNPQNIILEGIIKLEYSDNPYSQDLYYFLFYWGTIILPPFEVTYWWQGDIGVNCPYGNPGQYQLYPHRWIWDAWQFSGPAPYLTCANCPHRFETLCTYAPLTIK